MKARDVSDFLREACEFVETAWVIYIKGTDEEVLRAVNAASDELALARKMLIDKIVKGSKESL